MDLTLQVLTSATVRPSTFRAQQRPPMLSNALSNVPGGHLTTSQHPPRSFSPNCNPRRWKPVSYYWNWEGNTCFLSESCREKWSRFCHARESTSNCNKARGNEGGRFAKYTPLARRAIAEPTGGAAMSRCHYSSIGSHLPILYSTRLGMGP